MFIKDQTKEREKKRKEEKKTEHDQAYIFTLKRDLAARKEGRFTFFLLKRFNQCQFLCPQMRVKEDMPPNEY